MSRKQNNHQGDPTTELLRDLLILELAKAGVPQQEIRKLIGCDILRVSRFAKVLKKVKPVATQ